MNPTARLRGAPNEGPPSDNQSSDPHGATVIQTGCPVVVSDPLGLSAAQVERLRDAVADVPVCPRCVKEGGACAPCLTAIGPRMRRNPIAADTHSGRADVLPAPLSPEAAKVKARKERRAQRKAVRHALAPASPEPERRRKARGRRPGALGFMDAFKRAA